MIFGNAEASTLYTLNTCARVAKLPRITKAARSASLKVVELFMKSSNEMLLFLCVLIPCLYDGWLQKSERAFGRIELGLNTKRDRQLAAYMAERKAIDAGNAEITDELIKYLRQRI